jgi:hypothetical protein
VGVELLLDEVWAHAESPRRLFVAAVARANPRRMRAWVQWPDAGDPARFLDLRHRLLDYGAEPGTPPDRLAWRVQQALSPRPRLALRPSDGPAVERFFVDFAARVSAEAPAVLRATLDRLAAQP